MNLSNAVQSLSGWSIGRTYSEYKVKEDEVRQGTSDFIPFIQTLQFTQVSNAFCIVNSLVPPYLFKCFVNLGCHFSFLSIVPFGAVSLIERGTYTSLAQLYNQYKNKVSKNFPELPLKFSQRTLKVISFIFKHSGNAMRLSMIGTSLAAILLGNAYFGGGILAAVSYQALDQLGYVPRKVSLFMERYLPVVNLLGLTLQGSFFTRIFSAIQILSVIRSPVHSLPVHSFVEQKIDFLYRKVMLWYISLPLKVLEKALDHSIKEKDLSEIPIFSALSSVPTLSQTNQPLIERGNLSHTEMMKILQSEQNYKINPPHYTHLVHEPVLTCNYNFNLFLQLFNEIDWMTKAPVLEKKLKDDERFIELIEENFPYLKTPSYRDQNNKLNKDQLDLHIQLLADQKKLSREEFFVSYFKEEFKVFMLILKGEQRVKGKQEDLDEALPNYAKVLFYLQSLEKEKTIEKEDFLIKIAIDAGNYCALRIKQTAQDLVQQITYELAFMSDSPDVSHFALEVEQQLQNKRKEILDTSYAKYTAPLKSTQSDLHLHSHYYAPLSLGFYPLKRNPTNFSDVMVRNGLISVQHEMFKDYEKFLYGEFRQSILLDRKQNNKFATYIAEKINQNPSLTDEEKQELIDFYSDIEISEEERVERQEKFFLLMLVQLGIVIPC